MASQSLAVERFGLGARGDEALPPDPRRWLLNQFDRYDPRPAAIASAPTSVDAARDFAEYRMMRRDARMERRQDDPQQPQQVDMPPVAMTEMTRPSNGRRRQLGQPRTPQQMARRELRQDYVAAVGARMMAALDAPAPFVERLVHFWANHFAVSADKATVLGMAGPLEFEAIRPHVLGKFSDMLFAVEQHPAMLFYLDQAQSIGPGSMAGQRVRANGRQRGLNENLAREIMELHTLGVRSGYSQADVTEFARAMTGWTVAGQGAGMRGGMGRGQMAGGEPGSFLFRPAYHEPGTRTIMGKSYGQAGEAQARAVLADLAVHPATAKHIATKLARHFANDTPPPALVDRLAAAFQRSGGDLPTVYRALIEAPEAWDAASLKFKTPWDWTVSSMRALGTKQADGQQIVGLLNQLGQPVWQPKSPAGYDDIAASWAGPDALVRRVEAAERFAARTGAGTDARALAAKVLGDRLQPATAQAIARAESPGQGVAMLLAAPEFLRR